MNEIGITDIIWIRFKHYVRLTPLDNIRLFMLDDGIWYDPQTETGHPGFTGQISKDSRNIDKLYINPGPDSLKIDENTNH